MLQVKKRKIKLKQYNFIVSDEMKKKNEPFEEHGPSPTCLGTIYICELHCCLDKMQSLQENQEKKVTRETSHDYLISPGFS